MQEITIGKTNYKVASVETIEGGSINFELVRGKTVKNLIGTFQKGFYLWSNRNGLSGIGMPKRVSAVGPNKFDYAG